ncbi:MAG: hypothetical protein COB60_12160 [Flavobacteriaceae bacterium]|nr:MAG: hypothetical protein COB60_12160 [Flavobacteriaceae bacterium]
MLNLKNISKLLFLFFVVLQSCGAYFNQPMSTSAARIGENTSKNRLSEGLQPVNPIMVGVYKFRDQTGQYKASETGGSWSTAVTQGGTAILLKSLADSKFFTPIERENVSNLLNERQIIRSTRQQYANDKKDKTTSIPPLLFAGVILEGGVVSYDTNIISGGSGLRYFGAGVSNQYREDRITIYLRAVSTLNGEILKNVYVSKTILSQGVSANLYRYVALKRLLEVETGYTTNEPNQLAVKEAIDKAVELLIVEGTIDGIWKVKGGETVVKLLKEKYDIELNNAKSTVLLNRKLTDRRGMTALSLTLGSTSVSNDLASPELALSANASYKLYLKKMPISLQIGLGYQELKNTDVFYEQFATVDVNVCYDFLQFEKISPFIYGGVGTITLINGEKPHFKGQYGLGLEYFVTPKIGLQVFGEQNLYFSDELEEVIHGTNDDFYWKFGAGINIYFGKPYKRVKAVLFD